MKKLKIELPLRKTLQKIIKRINSVIVYTVFLTQENENAPTASVLQNEIGNLTWQRTSAGVYTITSNKNVFKAGKTTPESESYIDGNDNKYVVERTSENVITLTTYDADDLETPADNVLDNQFFNIEIYE